MQVLQISLNAKVFSDILPGTFIPNAENIYCSIENAPALPSVIFERDRPKQVTGDGFTGTAGCSVCVAGRLFIFPVNILIPR